jgi:hypothetical protein
MVNSHGEYREIRTRWRSEGDSKLSQSFFSKRCRWAPEPANDTSKARLADLGNNYLRHPSATTSGYTLGLVEGTGEPNVTPAAVDPKVVDDPVKSTDGAVILSN